MSETLHSIATQKTSDLRLVNYYVLISLLMQCMPSTLYNVLMKNLTVVAAAVCLITTEIGDTQLINVNFEYQ